MFCRCNNRKQDLLYCVYYECDIDSNSRVGVLRRDVGYSSYLVLL